MADLYLDAPNSTTVRWQATGISRWNSSNYQRIVLSSGTTGNGSSSAPSGIVDTAWPPPTGTNTYTPLRSLGASPSTTYYRYCYALDTANNLWWYVGEGSVRTPADVDTTDPTLGFSTPSGSNVTQTSIYVYVTGSDNKALNYFRFSINGTSEKVTYVSGTWADADHTFTGLSPGTTYSIEVRVVDAAGNWTSITRNVTTEARTRPSSWSWYSSKSSGGTFNLGAEEWKNFFNRINDFRSYKGWSSYSYTNPIVGGDYTASMYNQARNAINTMSPPTSIPVYRNSGDIVYAYDINRLRDSLNSIT